MTAVRKPTRIGAVTIQPEPTLLPFFAPTGVAVIGASANPTKLGFGIARNLTQSGYTGAIHFVNPGGGRLLERPVYRAVAAVPDPVDLAVLLIPAPMVPEALAAVGERGIRAAIIASGGFRETGPAGAALEDECLRVARDYHMRLVGPNCIGTVDTHLPLDTTFLPPPGPSAGDIAFISHSGAICAAVIDWARGQGFGLSRLVSLGNQIDVRETDMLTTVAADPHTRVITLYLEGVSDGRRFVRAARQVSREKPVLALKVGRFAAGQKAVASHTGALAGQESAFKAAFQRAGVIRAETSEELFDWARALAWCPLPAGRNVAVLTNAGGPGVTAADALEALGLQLAPLSEATQGALHDILSREASVRNPVDMLAAATAQQYAEALRIVLEDPGVDSALVIIPPPPMESAGGVARATIPIIYAATKPVVVALMGERMIQEAVEYFRAARVPDYRFPERAAAALAVLADRADFVREQAAQPYVAPVPPDGIHPDQAIRALAEFETNYPDRASLPVEVVQELMLAYGLRLPRAEAAESAEDAAVLAAAMGFPVALKVIAPTIDHKSDVGGVLLNLDGPAAVRHGYTQIVDNVLAAHPDARIDGVLVQQMIPGGQELIVGAVQDPQFGAIVMAGSGGVEVEGLGDVAFNLAPLSPGEAEALLEATWAGRRLRGFRNLPPADRDAAMDALRRLAQLAADFPQIAEIEINPLRVLPDGAGVYAVDVRARLDRDNR
jgi:acetyltransferase